MHESSLMRGLVGQLERIVMEQGARRVAVVRVRLGALSHFSPEHFREHFEEASRGGVSEGAELEIESSRDLRDPKAQEVWLTSVDLEWAHTAPDLATDMVPDTATDTATDMVQDAASDASAARDRDARPASGGARVRGASGVEEPPG